MKYPADMDSGAMEYILSFMKIGSGFQKLIWGYIDSKVISKV
jgi:hypothetical protein